MKALLPRRAASSLTASLTAVIGIAIGVITPLWNPVAAQTLDQQYDFFLRNAGPTKCANLGFQRDSATFEMAPGQAGPNLFNFCNGIFIVNQSPGTTTATATGASAALSHGGQENDTLRRRRERAQAIEQTELPGGFSAFASADYRSEDQAATVYEGGAQGERIVVTAGIDKRISNTLLLGGVARLGRLSGTFDGGGEFDSQDLAIAFYSSWLPTDDVFIDANVGIDTQSHWSTRIVGRTVVFVPIVGDPQIRFAPFYAPVDADYGSAVFNLDVGFGYDFHVGQLTVGPRVSGRFVHTRVDDYVESGQSPMSLAFDAQSIRSLQSGAGFEASIALNIGGAVLVPQLNLNWLHEFNDDQRSINVRFAEDLRPTPKRFQYLNQPPDRDVYVSRLSVVLVLKNGISAFATADKLLDHDYRDQFGGSLGVRVEL